MNKLVSRTIIATLIVAGAAAPFHSHAQSFEPLPTDRNLIVSIGGGATKYFGDLVNPGELGIITPNFSGSAEMYLTSRFAVRTELTWFQLRGSDARANDDRVQRNLSFKSNNVELAALGVMNLFSNGFRFHERPLLNIHAFTGVGVLWHNPRAKADDGTWHSLQPLQTENVRYSRVQPVVPVGLGAKVWVNQYFNIALEVGYRFVFTDYLDDVSSRRYQEVRSTNPYAAQLADRRLDGDRITNPLDGRRGNPDANDAYLFTRVSLQYYLPKFVFGDVYRKLYTVKRKAYYSIPGH